MVIGQRFLEPVGLAPFNLDGFIKRAQCVFDALLGADRIVGVDVRCIAEAMALISA
jgi:hypothetical protein